MISIWFNLAQPVKPTDTKLLHPWFWPEGYRERARKTLDVIEVATYGKLRVGAMGLRSNIPYMPSDRKIVRAALGVLRPKTPSPERVMAQIEIDHQKSGIAWGTEYVVGVDPSTDAAQTEVVVRPKPYDPYVPGQAVEIPRPQKAYSLKFLAKALRMKRAGLALSPEEQQALDERPDLTEEAIAKQMNLMGLPQVHDGTAELADNRLPVCPPECGIGNTPEGLHYRECPWYTYSPKVIEHDPTEDS